jgi:hypothetical protein
VEGTVDIGNLVPVEAKTDVLIAFDHIVLGAASSGNPIVEAIAFVDVDGYKTINIWTKGIEAPNTFYSASWSFLAAGETFTGQVTPEVRAPRLRIKIENHEEAASDPITVVIYTVS